ncbi:MAG: DUF2155 domain-containing protein, partial [Pseudomonadota bacterium]
RLSRSPSGAGLSTTLYGSTAEDERVAIDVTLRALDKITARFTDLTVPIGEAVEFGSLTLLPRTCSTRPPEEFPETSVFLEVYAGDSDVAGQRARVDDSTAADDETLLGPAPLDLPSPSSSLSNDAMLEADPLDTLFIEEVGLDPLTGDAAGLDEGSEGLEPVLGFQDEGVLPLDGEPVGPDPLMASIDEALFGEAIFKGWMFASTPSINALEHPTYDVWVIACTMEDPDA